MATVLTPVLMEEQVEIAQMLSTAGVLNICVKIDGGPIAHF
jgi:hypothetical protein